MINYSAERAISTDEFIDLLVRSTLAERRPIADHARMEQMLKSSTILISAWDGPVLVGISRALSDFSFSTYICDLAVDVQYQHQGIGKKLIEWTEKTAGDQSGIILLAAPKAVDYYSKIGMKKSEVCFVIDRKE